MSPSCVLLIMDRFHSYWNTLYRDVGLGFLHVTQSPPQVIFSCTGPWEDQALLILCLSYSSSYANWPSPFLPVLTYQLPTPPVMPVDCWGLGHVSCMWQMRKAIRSISLSFQLVTLNEVFVAKGVRDMQTGERSKRAQGCVRAEDYKTVIVWNKGKHPAVKNEVQMLGGDCCLVEMSESVHSINKAPN